MTPETEEARQGNGGPSEDELREGFSVPEAEPVAKGGALTVYVTPSRRDVATMTVFAAYDENEVDPYVVEVLTLLVTASEHIRVVAGVVAAVGDDAALVLSHVKFRTSDESLKCYERDGYRWWRATAAEVAADTGLSYDTAKRVRRSLIVKGFLVGIEHGLDGPGDRAISVRLALQPLENTEGANLHGRGGKSARSRGGKSARSSSSEEREETPLPPVGEAAEPGRRIDRGGFPEHEHEGNAVRTLARVREERRLPLSVDELLGFAYMIGSGNPWRGWQMMDATTNEVIGDDVRAPASVLRYRLRELAKGRERLKAPEEVTRDADR